MTRGKMQTRSKIILTIAIMSFGMLQVLALSSHAEADSTGAFSEPTNEELDVIEAELERSAPKHKRNRIEEGRSAERKDVETDISVLSKLQPFNEISVIQKRYLPKTGRFQLAGALTWVTNDPFFNTYGGSLHFGYFFTELWGVEIDYMSLSSTPTKATNELLQIQGVGTENLVYPKTYLGLNCILAPIYGKMTWLNNRIVPYDFFFTFGGGNLATQAENVGALHIGAGQLFSISKRYAFRWDFGWNFFKATGIDNSKGSFNSLYLNMGFSVFFPEAKYR